MDAIATLQPVFAVGILTTAMALWMVVTRIPAMSKHGIEPKQAAVTSKLHDLLPQEIMRVSDNYNHLFEQPTLFYAVAISIAVLGHVDTLYVQCAWAYAVLRILHSIVQATTNVVEIRFGLFALSWAVLGTMTLREAVAVFA